MLSYGVFRAKAVTRTDYPLGDASQKEWQKNQHTFIICFNTLKLFKNYLSLDTFI